MFEGDESTFKALVITPESPSSLVQDENSKEIFEFPKYTRTMALGNLTVREVQLFHRYMYIARTLERLGHYRTSSLYFKKCTDLVIASQNYGAQLLTQVMVQQHSIFRKDEGAADEEEEAEKKKGPVSLLLDKMRENQRSQGGSRWETEMRR